LVVALFGAGGNVASEGSKEITHHFTLGADLVLFGGILWYMGDQVTGKATNNQNQKQRILSVIITAVGSLLVCMDPMRHVLLDHNIWVGFLPMYDDDGSLSCMGRFCQISTIFGLICVMVGMAMFLKLPEKISERMCA